MDCVGLVELEFCDFDMVDNIPDADASDFFAYEDFLARGGNYAANFNELTFVQYLDLR
jgi:hypothetical protein